MDKIILKMGNEINYKGNTFTQLIGGFNNDNPILTIKQIAKLLNSEDRTINQTINRNINYFESKLHIIDLKNSITESDSVYEMLISQGYSRQSIANSKNIYVLSQAGFLLFLKFAEGDKAVELYKDFIEDYFKTKAENKILKLSLQEELDKLYEQYDSLYGKAIRLNDRELFIECSKIQSRIVEVEKLIIEEMTIEKYKIYEDKFKQFMDTDGCFTFEAASKILSTKADDNHNSLNIKLNKSSLPKYLRDKEILCKDKTKKGYKNFPRTGYEKYFNTTARDIEVVKDNEVINISKTQTRITKLGLDFIYDLLIKEAA